MVPVERSVVGRGLENAVADLGEGEPGLDARLGDERVGREARRGVEFEHVAASERRHAEVDARHAAAGDRVIRVEGELLHLLGERIFVRKERIARLLRNVLLLVSVPAALGDDLDYGERLPVDHADREFAAGEELLDENHGGVWVVWLFGCLGCGLDYVFWFRGCASGISW